MNPVIARNIEHINYTMDGERNNTLSTQGVPIEAFTRQNKYKNDRKKNEEANRTWIKRNKQQIKLQSIMIRGQRDGRSSTNDEHASSLDDLRDNEIMMAQNSRQDSIRGDI